MNEPFVYIDEPNHQTEHTLGQCLVKCIILLLVSGIALIFFCGLLVGVVMGGS